MIISYVVFGPIGPLGFLALLGLFAFMNEDCREMLAAELRKIKEEK